MTRDEVIKALGCCTVPAHCDSCPYDGDDVECINVMVRDAIALLEAEPKRGRWEPNPYDRKWSFCSACGAGTELVVYEDGGTKFYNYGFCPWCGAKMEVNDEDQT